MTFDLLVGSVNQACLNTFGRAFVFRRIESSPPAESFSISGILESGIETEDMPPAEGSTYARLWMQSGDIDPAPQKGDEIASGTTVYKIVRMEEDAGGGLWLLLRQDRGVT